MEILKNEFITARINPKGAELSSVMLDGVERMWQADPAIWGRHSPLLFPLIGRLKEQKYEYDGRVIDAPTHGFCRDRMFQVVEKTDTLVRFRTESDNGTMDVYPFSFTLEVEFELAGYSIIKRHKVTNCSPVEMPFEVGGHDAYRTTLCPGEAMSDYAIAFEGLEELHPYAMDEKGILGLPEMVIPLENGLLTKLPEQVGLDTIVLSDLPVRKATLVSRKTGTKVTVEFDDFPYLGIWTAQKGVETHYICIEPWSTLPDGHFMGRGLKDKTGICLLAPDETRTLTYTTTFA